MKTTIAILLFSLVGLLVMNTNSVASDMPDASSPRSNEDISDILAKAEAHDGIVIEGFYLGMSFADACRVAQHFGYDLRFDDTSNACDYYKAGRDGEIFVAVLKKNRKVERFRFRPAFVKKLMGSKGAVSKTKIVRQFFIHYDLDDNPGDIPRIETTDGECICYDEERDFIWWSFDSLSRRPAELKY